MITRNHTTGSVADALEHKVPVENWTKQDYDSVILKYSFTYYRTRNNRNWLRRFFRRIYKVDPLLAQYSPDQIRKSEVGVAFSFQQALYGLKQKRVRMNRFSRWLVDLKPLIDQCELSLQEAVTVRDMIFSSKEIPRISLECKRFSSERIKTAYQKLSEQCEEHTAFIQSIIPPITDKLIPTERINYFTRGCGFPIRYVHPRVSGGQIKNYKNLIAEVNESVRERKALALRCPTDYRVNHLDYNPDYKRWSDQVDDCDARRSYAEAEISRQLERIPEFKFSEICRYRALPLYPYQAIPSQEVKCSEPDPETLDEKVYFNHPIENYSDIKTLVQDYLGEDTVKKLYINPFRMFCPRMHEIFLNPLLQLVAYGEQEQAKIILTSASKKPGLLLQLLTGKGTVIDYSGRAFKGITAFQYALWALDWHMWRMILPYFDLVRARVSAAAQLEELESEGTAHGAHYDFGPYITALEAEAQYYREWDNRTLPLITKDQQQAARNQLEENWCKRVGMLQRQLPAHVVNEYCRGRAFFPLTPTIFRERNLPRTQVFYNELAEKRQSWLSGAPVEQAPSAYPKSIHKPDAKLGIDFAITRGVRMPVGHTADFPGGKYSKGLDLAAIHRLSVVRNEDLARLKIRLLVSNKFKVK